MARRGGSTEEISTTEDCPCGSGKTYGHCCKRRKFSWKRRSNGALVRTTKIPPELVTVLKNQEEEFIEIFGRKPRGADPVFFQKFYMSDADLERQTLDVMKAASCPPSIAYAYRKTGRLVTTANKGILTPGELKEWNEAVDEYYTAIEAGEEINVFEQDELTEFLKDALRKNQIVGGSFIDSHFNRCRKIRPSVADVEAVIGFATTNFVRCLKSIYILIEENVAFDAYHLIRAMYENYITAKYLYKNATAIELFSAQMGILTGTHRLSESRSGVPNRSEIIEIATGNKISIPTRWFMASSLGPVDAELYNTIYRPLSSYVHSEITTVRHFLSEHGYDYQRNDFTLDVLANCHILCFLFFSSIFQHSPCLKYLKRDLSIIAERSLFALCLIESGLAEENRNLPDAYKEAIADVTSSDPHFKRIADAISRTATSHFCRA